MKTQSRSYRTTAGAAVLLVLVAALALVSACGGNGSDSQGGSTAQIATYAYLYEPVTNWDPALEYQSVGTLLNVYETLTRWNAAEQKADPLLATEWSSAKGGMTWTFKIREGVTFHDGTELDAAAVKSSIERTIKMGVTAFVWAPVDTIKTPDKYTVVFNLKFPAAMDTVASAAYGAFIYSPTAVSENGDKWFGDGNEAGTGPYMLQKWTLGKEAVLTKYAGYWGGWDGKHLDKVVIKTVPETALRRQLLESGEADVANDLPPQDLQALAGSDAVDVVTSPSFKNFNVGFVETSKPLDDVLVRRALTYAFPYTDVVEFAAGGNASQARGPVPAGVPGHDDQLPQLSLDLDKARQLLADAGVADGFSLVAMYASGDELSRKALELYKEKLQEIGVTLDIRSAPFQSLFEQSKQEKPPFQVLAGYWWPTYVTAYDWLWNLYSSQSIGVYNMVKYSNPDFDALIDQAFAAEATDRQKADELYGQAQQILSDDAVGVFALDTDDVTVVSTSLKGYEFNPAYQFTVFFYECYKE